MPLLEPHKRSILEHVIKRQRQLQLSPLSNSLTSLSTTIKFSLNTVSRCKSYYIYFSELKFVTFHNKCHGTVAFNLWS